MRRTLFLFGIAVAASAAACVNPAVDPNATFEAQGKVVDSMGAPLVDAEVRLIKYSSGTQLFTPSTENLFRDAPANDPDLDLSVSIVQKVRTGMDGTFTMTFTGADIAAPGGYTTAQGLVEVATTVIVVRDPDPMNSDKRAGVYTYSYEFSQSNKGWLVGLQPMNLWNADARADTSRALTHGLVDFSWNKLEKLRMTDVRNGYQVDIGAQNSPARLIVRCSEGDIVQGGCSADGMQRLTRAVSAFSLQNYYSDNTGMFGAIVQANGADFRYVARFTVTAPIPMIPRDPIAIQEIWAVGMGADQSLLGTKANDGNIETRELINNNATAIYVKLTPDYIDDAGLLNSLLSNAENGCVILEFASSNFDIASAKTSSSMDWTPEGKFCGENGAKGEVSALASFDTTGQNGILAAWLRLRAVPDGAGAAPVFQAVGEIGVYKRTM